MNGPAKRCQRELAALGFTLDFERSNGDTNVWVHVNDPAQPVKVWRGISDAAARHIIDRARRIDGLSSVGPATTGQQREQTRERRRQERQAERETQARTAWQREHPKAPNGQQMIPPAEGRRIVAAERRRREIEALMRPPRSTTH